MSGEVRICRILSWIIWDLKLWENFEELRVSLMAVKGFVFRNRINHHV